MIITAGKSYFYIAMMQTLLLSSSAGAHSLGPRGLKPLHWHTEQISSVVATGGEGRTLKIDGRDCVTGTSLNFDVRDEYAFDIDEVVELVVDFALEGTHPEVALTYDKNDGSRDTKLIRLEEEQVSWEHKRVFVKKQFILERARFANLAKGGIFKLPTDINISPKPPNGTNWGEINLDSINKFMTRAVTVCDIQLKRSYTTHQPSDYGSLSLTVLDENGQRVSARVGIYDVSGRMPLPGPDALSVKSFEDWTRVITLRPGGESWPAKNRQAFYVNGKYRSKFPAGHYQIVVARGLEYRIAQLSFDIEAGKNNPIVIKLQRWVNMPAMGWYSGDVHIHVERANQRDDDAILKHTRAEDLHIANILQMGGIGATDFHQYNWGRKARYGDDIYTLVPGQEDPRTIRHGHAIQLNISDPVRNHPERYYQYHEVFEKVRQQGGISGYAHVLDEISIFNRRGMALDIPFGLIDFVEVMSQGNAGTNIWFDFLNLGYKLSPAAGTDYPYVEQPGTVRSYVKMNDNYSVQGWFDGLKAGRTFVTNGPMLEFTVNGQGVGSEIHVDSGTPLIIEARAIINPDIDMLDRLELFEQGEVVAKSTSKQGDKELRLTHEVQAGRGTWFVLRAHGKQEGPFANIVALSAPVYVYVDEKGFCQLDGVPSIVANIKEQIRSMVTVPAKEQDFEFWNMPRENYWPTQKVLLQQRIDEAIKVYDNVVNLASERRCITDGSSTR